MIYLRLRAWCILQLPGTQSLPLLTHSLCRPGGIKIPNALRVEEQKTLILLALLAIMRAMIVTFGDPVGYLIQRL